MTDLPQYDPAAPPGGATAASKNKAASKSLAAADPAGDNGRFHARLIGMLSFGLGVGLTDLAFFWALDRVHSRTWEVSASPGTLSVSLYSGWGAHQLVFLLFLLLITFAGWLIAGLGAKFFSGGAAHVSHGPGMAIGAIVFAGGIGLVILVFLTAQSYFAASGAQVPIPAAGGPAPDYIGWGLNGLLRLLLLALMALNGALIAGRGAQMFLGTLGRV